MGNGVRRTFHGEQERNRRRLRVLVGMLLLLSTLTGYVAGRAFERTTDPEAWFERMSNGGESSRPVHRDPAWQLAAACLLLAAAAARRAARWGDEQILTWVDARPCDDARARHVVEEMAVAALLPCPEVKVVEEPARNAFACVGRGGRATVVFTRGLLQALERDELQAVAAHELGHIRNGDARVDTVLLGLAASTHLLGRLLLGPLHLFINAARHGVPDDASDAGEDAARPDRSLPTRPWLVALMPLLAVAALVPLLALSLAISLGWMLVVSVLPWLIAGVALIDLARRAPPPPRREWPLLLWVPCGLATGPALLVAGVLLPFVLFMTRLALSRGREFAADATAVELTRHPAALRAALGRLGAGDPGPAPVTPRMLPRSLGPALVVPWRPERSLVEALEGEWGDDLPDDHPLYRPLEWVRDLWRSHPPLAERRRRLADMLASPLPDDEVGAAPPTVRRGKAARRAAREAAEPSVWIWTPDDGPPDPSWPQEVRDAARGIHRQR